MEILNNIWMALSTPNESLVKTILIFATFFENFLSMKLFVTIFNVSVTKKSQYIYVLILSLFFMLSMNIFPAPFNVFINYMFNILLSFLTSSRCGNK